MRLEHLLSGAIVPALLRHPETEAPHALRPEVRRVARDGAGTVSRVCCKLIAHPAVAGPHGGLAQLARAPALQAGGQRFESVILHKKREHIDIMEARPVTQVAGREKQIESIKTAARDTPMGAFGRTVATQAASRVWLTEKIRSRVFN